jgi:hypothetical protein
MSPSTAWAQVLKADQFKPLLATKVAPNAGAKKPQFKTMFPTMARGPQRLTVADYQAMLPHLATLTNLPRTSLAAQPFAATNLATPGGVLNVGILAAPPGGGFQATGTDWVFSYSPWSMGAPIPACIVFQVPPGAASSYGVAGFTAPIQGPGTYMMTVYVETPLSQVSVSTSSGAPGTVGEFTGPNTIAIQNGKVIVVHEVTAPRPKELQIWINPFAGNSNAYLQIYSCDFMRIR